MIAIDTNVLVHADREELPKHVLARDALRTLAEGDQPWGVPVFTISEFLRVVTHEGAFASPTPLGEALDLIDGLLASPTARLLLPGSRFLSILRRTATHARASGNVVFDAQIAAVCLEHGADTILTEDRDFLRFPGIRVQRLS